MQQEYVYAFGCAGNVGKQLVPRLIAMENLKIKFIYHNTEVTMGDVPAKCKIEEIVQGDLGSVESIKSILSGRSQEIDRILLIMPTIPTIHVIVDNFVEAMKGISVKQVIWIMECDPPQVLVEKSNFYATVPKAVAVMKNSGLPVTRLEPGCFFQNFLSFYGLLPVLQGGQSEFSAPFPSNIPIQFVDVRDIAKAASVIIAKPPESYVGSHIRLVGDSRTINDCVVAAGTVVGRKIHYKQVSESEFSDMLKALGFPDWMCADAPPIFHFHSGFCYGFDSSELSALLQVLGDKPSSLEGFFKDHAELFNASPPTS